MEGMAGLPRMVSDVESVGEGKTLVLEGAALHAEGS